MFASASMPVNLAAVRRQRFVGLAGLLICLLMAFVDGLVFWELAEQFLPISGLFMAVFLLGRFGRLQGFAVFSAFYLGGTFPLAQVGSTMLEISPVAGVSLWLAHGLLCSLPVLLLRGKYPGARAALVAVLYFVPPFGYLAPNNPAILTGLFFPQSSLLGPACFVLLAMTLGASRRAGKSRLAVGATLAVLCLGLNISMLANPKAAPPNWHAVVGNFGPINTGLKNRMDFANLALPEWMRIRTQTGRLGSGQSQVWFLPEGMIYDW